MTKSLIILLALTAGIFCEELLVTKAYTDYLKKHVDWEVVDYEENIFRGWTISEAKQFLGTVIPASDTPLPVYESSTPPPSSIVWQGDCIHAVRNQGSCGSCWTFATAGMLSDRCCLHSTDHGWLAPQELVSCDIKDDGCSGGWPAWALLYIIEKKGLVPEDCFPYLGEGTVCPTKCKNGADWASAHVCNCHGLKQCLGVENLKKCLTSGTVAVTFEVCSSFFSYRSGIYKCECTDGGMGLHSVAAIGYAETPECHWIVRNSWATYWGDKGYFKIACKSCGMDGKYPNGNVMCEKVY